MIIKSYQCSRFAGIKDKNIQLEDHLNVILGPNEAGKSTVVEGIYSVLFKSAKLGNLTTQDKEFKSKFMPVQSGDTIDGSLVISSGAGEYRLSREWGESSFSKLITPGGQVIKDEGGILEELADVLHYGEATYSSIFFSKQSHIKEAIEAIHADGGLAVLAHPYLLSQQQRQIEAMLLELSSLGLDGVEVFYTEHSDKYTAMVAELAQRLGLLMSGGSDFHGAVKPGVALGKGRGGLFVRGELLDTMKKSLGARG